MNDQDFALTLVNKPLAGVLLMSVSDVTATPRQSSEEAVSEFMRGFRKRSKASDGFDPQPVQACGLTAQQVTFTAPSPNGALTITVLAVAVPNGPRMHLAALIVEGYNPDAPQFQSDSADFLRQWKIVQPGEIAQ